MEKQKK